MAELRAATTRTRFSPLVARIGGRGAEGWQVHFEATQAAARGEDVVVLSVGDPDFGTPEGITDRAIDALDGEDTHYADIAGRPALRRAIADYVGGLSGVDYGPEQVVVAGGTQNAMFGASLCLLGPGDEVIVPDPAYLTYEATLQVGGATLVPVPLTADGFRLDPDAIAAVVTPATRAICVNSPANPTGVVHGEHELRRVAQIAVDHDLWVITDEVYAELVFDGRHCSIAAFPGMAERTVIVGGLSKSHAMTGWRIGWAVGPEALIRHMGTLALCMLYGLPPFVQEAGLTAITEHAGDVAAMREIYRRRRDLVCFMLSDAPGIEVLRPEAGMFVVADVRGTGMGSAEFSRRLFDEQRVSVLDAANFGPQADGYVRISFTIDDLRLAEGCRRIVDFCHTVR